jgi:hypothetical protein
MTPQQLRTYLDQLVTREVFLSTMLWGPPGIGKSSIVAQVARDQQLEFVDVRLSQLAPTDLRGLPVPENGKSLWFPPEFLPDSGRGILFLDELNMAPPAMQGIAQQLILDRKVGSYVVPSGWFIWAAGNRKEDRASVYEMPAPLANRFLHLTVETDFDSFKAYALRTNLSERVIAFLSFRPSLLHKQDAQQLAWPSPRSWEMASVLLNASLEINSAIGDGAAAEFYAFESIYKELPSLEKILEGKGAVIDFPKEPSARYAVSIGLTARIFSGDAPAQRAASAFEWMQNKSGAEWLNLFLSDTMGLFRARGFAGEFATLAKSNPEFAKIFAEIMSDLRK